MMHKLITKVISNLNLPISNETIKETLMVHPLYPTLSCVSDAFDLWRIDHLIAKLSIDQINNIGAPIISSRKRDGLILITKITDRAVWFRDSNYRIKRVDKQKFTESWDGISILIQDIDRVKEYNAKYNKIRSVISRFLEIVLTLLAPICATVSCCITWRADIWLSSSVKALMLVNNVIGIMICLLLFAGKRSRSSQIFNKLCKKGKYVDCKKVINTFDDKSPALKYIIEIATGYFTTNVVWLLFATASPNWYFPLYIFFILSIPIIVSSLYIQLFYIKKICALCCAILLCLLINLSCIKADYVADSLSFLKYIILFLSFSAFFILINKASDYKSKYYKEKRANARLKININTFQANLSNARLETPEYGIHWGSTESKFELTVIVSLECKHCKELVQKILCLKDIYQNIFYKVVFDIPYDQEDKYEYFSNLYRLYKNGDTKQFLAMLNANNSFDIGTELPNHHNQITNYDDITYVLDAQRAFVDTAQVTYVPAIFINGRLLSVHYDFNDIVTILQFLSKL